MDNSPNIKGFSRLTKRQPNHQPMSTQVDEYFSQVDVLNQNSPKKSPFNFTPLKPFVLKRLIGFFS